MIWRLLLALLVNLKVWAKWNNSFEDGIFLFFFSFDAWGWSRTDCQIMYLTSASDFFGLFEVSAGVFWSWEWVNRTDFFGCSWGMGGFRGHHVVMGHGRIIPWNTTSRGERSGQLQDGFYSRNCRRFSYPRRGIGAKLPIDYVRCTVYNHFLWGVLQTMVIWGGTTTTSLLDNPHINTWHLGLQRVNNHPTHSSKPAQKSLRKRCLRN